MPIRWRDVLGGLAANLDAIQDVQVVPYVLSSPTPPTIDMRPSRTGFDVSFARGTDMVMVEVRAVIGLATDIGSQLRVMDMMDGFGADSIKVAAESDRTLGGLVDNVQVLEHGGLRQYPRDGHPTAVGAEWTVRIYT